MRQAAQEVELDGQVTLERGRRAEVRQQLHRILGAALAQADLGLQQPVALTPSGIGHGMGLGESLQSLAGAGLRLIQVTVKIVGVNALV